MLTTLFAFAALSSPAPAPQTNAIVAPDTRAGELAARFSGAGLSFAGASQGWFSGRCYRMDSPNQPMGVLLVTETRNPPSNEGPIFGRPVTKMLPVVHNPGSQNPEFFDNPSPQLTAEVDSFMNNVFASADFSEAYEAEGSLSSHQYSLNTRWDQRTDGTFSYIRTVNTRESKEFAYCYFFKRVR